MEAAVGSKHAREAGQTELETDCWLEGYTSVVQKVVEVLDEIRALLFSIRMRSPWITQREAERLLHCRSGALTEAVKDDEFPIYRRTPTSTVLINVHELNAWVSRTWIVRSSGNVKVG